MPLPKLLYTTTFRLSVLFLIVYGLTAVMALGYIYWNTNVLLIRQLNQTVQAEIQGLAEQYRQGGINVLARTIAERSQAPGISIYLVTDKNGQHIAGNLKSVSQQLWDTVGDVRFSYKRNVSTDTSETRQAFAKTFRLPNGYRLIVGRDIEDRHIFSQVITTVFWGLSFMTLIGLSGGWLVSRNLLSRIDRITAASQTIMNGHLSERIPVQGSHDELDRLSVNLNDMLDKIENLMNGLREVSDNIAHDLKTPLNRMRNRVEAALRDHNGTEKNIYRDALQATIDDADFLIKTFNALLSIAQMEAGSTKNTLLQIDLVPVVRDIAELYEPVIEEHGMELSVDMQGSVMVHADRQLLGQAIANLLDNAIKYGVSGKRIDTKEQPRIFLAIEQKDRFAHIMVADHGPGIPQSDLERVLERFVRLEQSRSLPGNGLGLSLVAAIVRSHRGEFRLEDNQPGLKATIRLPLL
ncbi:MAG: ATP-binding protein [Pseudomonadota bacterium]